VVLAILANTLFKLGVATFAGGVRFGVYALVMHVPMLAAGAVWLAMQGAA
jgi:hypothetical protein